MEGEGLVGLTAALLLASLLAAGFWARSRLGQRLGSEAPMDRRRGLGQFVRPYRIPLRIAVALTAVQTILDLAAPWPLKLAVDNIIAGHPLEGWMARLNGLSTAALAAIVASTGVALVGASAIVGYLTTYLIGAAAERVGADMRSAAFERLQHRSLRFHDRNRTGDLVARLTSDVSRVQDVLVSWFQTVLPEVLALLGMLAVLFALDALMALATLTVIPLLALQIAVSRAHIRLAEREARDRFGRLTARAAEVLRHVRAIQAFFRQDEEHRHFERENAGATGATLTALRVQARYSPTSDVILALGSALLLFLGVMRVTSGHMTVGTLLVILSYLSGFYHPIRSLTRVTALFAKGTASRERLMEIFADDEVVPEAPTAIRAPRGPGRVVLHGVAFGYRREEPALRDLSLEIGPTETVCVVGPTGAGKSTLLSLLLRFYDPDEGVITIDGIDLRRFTLRSIRERIAFVPQETWLLDGTIADNIRFGWPEASDADVRSAGRAALVEEFVARLPKGYDTAVGESGVCLSGGQRRRIALARAIVRDAPLLLLDEPTSGLDAASEALVLDALRGMACGRTVVIVSHRLRLVTIAHRVVVLDGGQIIEHGNPALLLAAGGAFARLWGHGESTLGPAAVASFGVDGAIGPESGRSSECRMGACRRARVVL
jgi:ATP-binding cassette subfamily B protein